MCHCGASSSYCCSVVVGIFSVGLVVLLDGRTNLTLLEFEFGFEIAMFGIYLAAMLVWSGLAYLWNSVAVASAV